VIPFALIGGIVAIASSRARNNSGARQQTSPTFRIVVLKVVVTVFCMPWLAMMGDFSRLLWLAVLVLFWLPTLLVGPLLVRLRMPRLAYWTMRCCLPLHYAGNQHAGAMLYATLSATRMRDPATACAWLDERFRGKPVNGVIGQTILGHLAAAQGDRVTAQCLFESIDARPRRPRRSIVRVTARDWLVMDAARRGDWSAALRCATRGGSTRWSRAVAGMAQTFADLGTPLPKWRLWLLWLVAPRRLRLRPLLQRALTVSVRQRESDIARPRDLPAALALLAETLARTAQHPGEVSSAEFLEAVRSVTIRLESADMKVQVEQRLAAFDSTLSRSADSVLSALKSDVVELILPVVAANPQLVEDDRSHPIIAEALHRLQGAAFESIEMRAKDLARRTEMKQSLDTLSEWRSWAILCDEANHLLTLQPDAKATLFEVVWRPLLNYAVFQHNDMTRHAFAQDIFRWLLAHAHGNRTVVDTLDKNIACYQPKD
jgi:hypothetical protein